MNIPYDKLPPVPAGHTVIGPLSDPFFPRDRSRVPEAGMLAVISVAGDRWETGRWCFDGSDRPYLALPNDHEMVKRWCEEKGIAPGTHHPVSKKWRTRDGRPVIFDLIPIPEPRTVIHVDPVTDTVLDEATPSSVRYTLSND